MEELDGFKYRARDAWRSVTKVSLLLFPSSLVSWSHYIVRAIDPLWSVTKVDIFFITQSVPQTPCGPLQKVGLLLFPLVLFLGRLAVRYKGRSFVIPFSFVSGTPGGPLQGLVFCYSHQGRLAVRCTGRSLIIPYFVPETLGGPLLRQVFFFITQSVPQTPCGPLQRYVGLQLFTSSLVSRMPGGPLQR